jgi:mismatch-specific thymine-DNA glycosylase
MPTNGAENVPVNDTASMNSDLNSYPYAGSAVDSSSQMISSATEHCPDNLKRELAASDPDSAESGLVSYDVPLSRKRQRRRMTTTTISSTAIQTARLSPPMTRSRSSSSSSQITSRTASPKKVPLRRRRATPTHSPSTSDSLLRDTIPANLILLLVGVNPGTLTGKTGYAYAHPSNLFWKLLFSSGITKIRHPPSDTYKLPELYSVGNTNIVERPTRDASMLSQAEIDAGVLVLQAKVAAQRPEVVCLVGKGIWEAVWRARHGRAIRKHEFRYGWQDETENIGQTPGSDWAGARIFVATTTSGLAAGMSMAQKEAVWAELGMWVAQRRIEKGLAAQDD